MYHVAMQLYNTIIHYIHVAQLLPLAVCLSSCFFLMSKAALLLVSLLLDSFLGFALSSKSLPLLATPLPNLLTFLFFLLPWRQSPATGLLPSLSSSHSSIDFVLFLQLLLSWVSVLCEVSSTWLVDSSTPESCWRDGCFSSFNKLSGHTRVRQVNLDPLSKLVKQLESHYIKNKHFKTQSAAYSMYMYGPS